jgi:hypothetical protein
VSAYGGESGDEWAAEAFADYYLNGDRAAEPSKRLGAALKQLHGRK